ncbi:hypothetical protein BSL78_24802 [Apostichopus japonicus]|uniref:GIY-YIG domain-containing protein n=1 Tax=Stichopus japonicus TaxID=307972 RepID=A0A2G8JRN3_STIJA|nr:hypothetical protein BSL78_24802 [Apostichopus japonicus]
MPNIASIIKGHNKRISATLTSKEKEAYNCRKKDTCPLNGNCQASNIIYKAEVKTTDNCKTYIGLTEPPFKLRYGNHKMSLNHEKHQNATELSKHIWQLKQNNQPFTINWSIASRAKAYSNESKRCNLCLTEKLIIINADKRTLLNKRPELISKCRHENKFYINNSSPTTKHRQGNHTQLRSEHRRKAKTQQQNGRKREYTNSRTPKKVLQTTNRTDAKENTPQNNTPTTV